MSQCLAYLGMICLEVEQCPCAHATHKDALQKMTRSTGWEGKMFLCNAKAISSSVGASQAHMLHLVGFKAIRVLRHTC